ncbi:MAG: cytochrome c3 family protein [Sutterellaceae bacterium]|nr:cytochrome c3 family protein [Sutterellaceae bacterium]MDD7443099.1 cytochrome c3 family protein [Sutterellaceae bacterium]MDY2868595.1 cytochrome c3 family protein [Mesosutterella sp.]
MKKTVIAAMLLAAAGLFALPSFAADPAPGSPEYCLQCHGPYDKLREQTKDWKDEFGDKIQPHQYMDPTAGKPHEARKLPPDCKECHGIHSIPPKKGEKHKQPTFSTCYGCHHMENFQKCSSSGCHEEGAPSKKK